MLDHRNLQPIVTSCQGCGACCTLVGFPPFLTEEWITVGRKVPAEIRHQIDQSRASAKPPSREGSGLEETPCIWLDRQTRKCMHYELRPTVCREFEIGGKDCVDHRRRLGLVVPHEVASLPESDH